MRISTLIILIILSVSTAVAQTNSDGANWLAMAPEIEEFQVDIPAEFDGSILKNDPSKPELNRRYVRHLNGRHFYIFSDNKKTPNQVAIVRTIADHFKSERKTLKFGRFEGERFAFADPDFYHTGLIIAGQRRIYVFQTISSVKDDPVVERFLASIVLRDVDGPDNSSVTPKADSPLTVTVPTAGYENRQDLGLTEFKKIRETTATGHEEPHWSSAGEDLKAKKKLKPLKIDITQRPEAKYIFFAHFYEISGSIRIRARFFANGTISNVEPLTKLPCGLTEQAMLAVRDISFKAVREKRSEEFATEVVTYRFGVPSGESAPQLF